MDALRCPPGDALVKPLSGGEKRRVALCRLLLQKPDILLLDEPTNHLDAETVQWLEQHLQRYDGTVIAVTHDRYFLDNVAGWILELDRGQGIPWKGNYSSWLEQKQTRLQIEEKTGNRAAEGAGARAGMGSPIRPGTTGQEQSAHPGVRADGRAGVGQEDRRDRDLHPARPAARRARHRRGRTSARPTATTCSWRT